MAKANISRTSGIALISVLFISIMVLILVVTFGFSAMSENRAARANKTISKLSELAEARSELARIKIGEVFRDEQYTAKAFMDAIRDQLAGGATIEGLDGNHSQTIAGTNSRWEIRAVSAANSQTAWVDIAATAENNKGSQTIIQRISFSPSDIFELVMLTEKVDCMICHIRVYGDIGVLEHFKPGWEEEGNPDDHDAGADLGGSVIHGNIYAARTITRDGSTNNDLTNINGAIVDGTAEENSKNRRLPKDLDDDDIPDFPPIDRIAARKGANGSATIANQAGGAIIKTINWNQNLNNLNPGSGSLGHVTNGHAIMIGTQQHPINLDENIFVEGDVIIRGVVTGQGGIYSGRNIYIAGNLTLANPPDTPLTGVCAGISDQDDCAKANIAANKDTLRLGARGSIIIGDYTEFQTSNPRYNYGTDGEGHEKRSDRMPWGRRQNEEFYRSQFGFGWSGANGQQSRKYYDIGNDGGSNIAFGDELEWNESKGGYINVDGKLIPNNRVLEVESNYTATSEIDGDDSYDYSFRPGHINTDGSFNSWVSDTMYRNILGTGTSEYHYWRYWVDWTNDRDSSMIDEEEFKANLRYSMLENGLSIADNNLDTIWDARLNNQDNQTPIIATNGDQIGIAHWGEAENDGAMLRILVTAQSAFETQVTEIDAFIYANQRIAGKTSMQPFAINGGLIAKDIGILVPGRITNFWPWNLNASTRDCDNEGDTYWVKGTENCALTLNYDYRLRNGGFGFDLVAANTGKTLSWYFADSAEDRVAE